MFIGTDYDARGTVKGHRIRTFIDVPDPVPEDTSPTWTHFGPYWDHYGSSLADGGPDPRTFVLVRDSRRCPVTTLRKVYVRAENERTAAIEVDASACRPADLHGYAEEVP
ncbi:MAG: hypothetical protein JNK04_14865 [Myxococcales bacterium]|nr:hypothetical protein [Myxococcales bacterium]